MKKEITILGETIELDFAHCDIHSLKFLRDNPRVYSCTHGHPNFDQMIGEQQQAVIYEKLIQEESVKNLIPDVKHHGGLLEPILIRYDTKEVIEGNSRLAVYRKLDQEIQGDDWQLIPCDVVSSLTPEQQAALLNQIHVKGKTRWSAYEKANFAFVRKEQGWSLEKISKHFNESVGTIRTRIKVIDMMKSNADTNLRHFSYYDVLVRNPTVLNEFDEQNGLKDFVLSKIKDLGPDEDKNEFTAQELRKKLPKILGKRKVLRKFVAGQIDLDQAYQVADTSEVEEKVKRATGLLDDVSMHQVNRLRTEQSRFGAFKQAVRKLSRQVVRISGIVDKVGTP